MANYLGEGERWTKGALRPGTAKYYPPRRIRPAPQGALDIITLRDGTEMQWWATDTYITSDGGFRYHKDSIMFPKAAPQ